MLSIALKNMAVSHAQTYTLNSQKNPIAELKNLIFEASTSFFEMDLEQTQRQIPQVFKQILQCINASNVTLNFLEHHTHTPLPFVSKKEENVLFSLFFEKNPQIAQFLKQNYPTLYIPNTEHTQTHPFLQILAEYCHLHNIKTIFMVTVSLPLSKQITSICTYFSYTHNSMNINEKITELLQKWATFVNYALDYQNVKLEEQQKQEINFLINQVASDFIAIEYSHIPTCIYQLLNNFACYLSANNFLIFKIDEVSDKLTIPYSWNDSQMPAATQTNASIYNLNYSTLNGIYPCLQQKRIIFLENEQQIRQKLPNLHLHPQYATAQAAIFIPITLKNNLKEIIALFTNDPNHTWTKNLRETLYSIIPLFTQIAEREHHEKQNLQLLELSNIIDNIAVQFILPTNLKSKINSAISKIANHLGAGIAQVFLFDNHHIPQATVFESYNNLTPKTNLQPAIILQKLTYTEHEPLLQKIINGNFVCNNTNNFSNLPNYLTSLNSYFVTQKIKNYLAVPITLKNNIQQQHLKNQSIIGFIHFMSESPMTEITPQVQNKLEMFSTMLAMAFESKKKYEFE